MVDRTFTTFEQAQHLATQVRAWLADANLPGELAADLEHMCARGAAVDARPRHRDLLARGAYELGIYV